MIVNADASALEWLVAAYLSKDKTAYKEILGKIDQHTLNQESFGLPSRGIAKIFVFRLLYGGQAWSYAHDPDFMDVSTSEKFWQKVIEKFYNKYSGISDWHTSIIREAMTTGRLVMPTGRIYKYEPKTDRYGELVAPETIIKNFPVQGLGADLLSIARVSFFKRFKEQGIDGYINNTVHDSIVVDVHEKEVKRVAKIFHEVFRDIPTNFERLFKVKFDLPLGVEVSAGPNMNDLTNVEI